jgi:putative selenate reductase
MNDRMRPIPFDKLMEWMLSEYKNEGSIFGIPSVKFYKKSNDKNLFFAGETIEDPVGPAAGPHTQLAQNIIAAYLCGARFIELKTVQVIDGEDLPVSKPCILAKDEGYNVEWSTELTVQDAFGEYVKAWFAINVLSEELGLGSNKGFAFNMSVGYDLAWIQSPKIDAFIEGMKDASDTPVWIECRDWLKNNTSSLKKIDRGFIEEISPKVCSSITLSTMHGCPPQEIERIARYLLGEKKLNTFVKCNPTLLRYDFVRNTLDNMGYDYVSFDEHHFNDDLQFKDAVPLIKRLQDHAKESGFTFGVKLSNTFPVKISGGELPGEEMYMSGRALYPLTINLAAKLAEAFGGDLRISYSGGADVSNIGGIYETGIWPVTFATTLLKPGGYARIKQLAELAEEKYKGPAFSGIDVAGLKMLAEKSLKDAWYRKDFRETEGRKIERPVPLTDCFIAPCKEGCPIGQDIPEYIRLAAEGRREEAFELITAKNPMPFTTGTICSHPCMGKCTRMDYDRPVDIRGEKLKAASAAFKEYIGTIKPPEKTGCRIAVIGAGPAGLSAGYYLSINGFDVTIFDRQDRIGGMPAHVIPGFRLSGESLDKDMELIRKSGVSFKLGASGEFSIDALKEEGFKYIFIAAGACKQQPPPFEAEDSVYNVLDFLERFKNKQAPQLGKTVAIIGAGNSAMDAARAAKRVPGVENVAIVYRRTKKYMPADMEELKAALSEGIEFKELLSPVSFKGRILKCRRTALGAPDASGRRAPVPTGETADIAADSVITATGEKPETDILVRNGIKVDGSGRPQAGLRTNETCIENVYIGGDVMRGPATVAEAIADGRKFADGVMRKEGVEPPGIPSVSFDERKRIDEINVKKGVLRCGEGADSGCFECGCLCNICAEVCPNRANVAVKAEGMNDPNQIVHIDGLCNACGSCEAFCPYQSAPYKDKFTLFWNANDFEDSDNSGFMLIDRESKRFKVRLGGNVTEIALDNAGKYDEVPEEIYGLIKTVYSDHGYLFILGKA